MTEDRMAPIEAIQKADDGDFTPVLAETVPRISWTPTLKRWSASAGMNARTAG